MTKKQQQVEIARLNQDLTELAGMYDSACAMVDTYKDEVACLKDKVGMLEMGTKLDKEQILVLEADLAANRLGLHRTIQRVNQLQSQLDYISFSM